MKVVKYSWRVTLDGAYHKEPIAKASGRSGAIGDQCVKTVKYLDMFG